jgi:leader peptidase (prepilin peptidase)/N-methyltransferase
MKSAPSSPWPLRILLATLLSVSASYVVVMPLIESTRMDAGRMPADRDVFPPMPRSVEIFARSMELVVAAWFFLLGASIGSFLNVVVYRLPRGMTLLGTSQCPKCATPILFRDNVPVLGWFLLGGRCRACKLPIAARYPLMEGLTGSLFLGLAFAELFSGGSNLPVRLPTPETGVLLAVANPAWELVRLYGFHACLLSALLTIALIAFDQQGMPRRLTLFIAAVGVVTALCWPDLHPVPWDLLSSESRPTSPPMQSLLTSFFGAVCGICIGVVIDVRLDDGRGIRGLLRSPMAAALLIVGIFLGWQATLALAVVAGGLLAVLATALGLFFPQPEKFCRPLVKRGLPACLLIATAVHLVFWRTLSEWKWWPGPAANWPIVVVWLVALLLAVELTRRIAVLDGAPGDSSGDG